MAYMVNLVNNIQFMFFFPTYGIIFSLSNFYIFKRILTETTACIT